MKRVVGIGGVFIKSPDPERLRGWYRQHLEFDVQEWGGVAFQPEGAAAQPHTDPTIWSVFEESTGYFNPSTAGFIVNYRVEDPDGVLAALRAEGCEVDCKTEQSEFGKFGWEMDPDDNRIELWEPPAG